jgi:4a-hydroxytetrahydrobiopterin dehydratase
MSEAEAHRLSDEEIQVALDGLSDWSREGDAVVRTYRLKDFATAMNFVNAVAELAEAARHHPDIDIRYNRVRIALSTHDAGGITRRDIELAEGIDGLHAG